MIVSDESDIDSNLIHNSAKFGDDVVFEEDFETEYPWDLFDERLSDIENAEVVLITDSGDSDGLGCAALMRHKFGDDVVILPASNRDWGKSPSEAVKEVQPHLKEGASLYITDLAPDILLEESDGAEGLSLEQWKDLVTSCLMKHTTVHFRDHHEYYEEFVEFVNSLEGCDYIHNEDICATKILLETDYDEAPDHIQDLANLTNVRDMFLEDHEDFERSSILSNSAFWLPFSVYVEKATEYGPEFTEDPELQSLITHRQKLKEEKLQWAMETADFDEINGYKIGLVYGDCYHSEAGRRLKAEHGADLAVIVKPNGGVSFRSDNDVLPICSDLATYIDPDGGGHPDAAGCKPFELDDEESSAKLPSVDEHQETNGKFIKAFVASKIRRFIDENDY